MKTHFLLRVLDFFVGVFVGISIFGGIFCFILLKDSNLLFSLVVSIAFFGVFSFFAVLARVLSVLLKRYD